jgi:inward rectifier potassium channel
MARVVISKTSFSTIEHIGLEISFLRDFYHNLLKVTWPRFIGAIIVGYLSINALFAVLYMMCPNAIANAEPGSFLHAFAFSVQTMATIGYGVFSPATPTAHIIVVFESVVSLLYTALCTGLTFSKFARPNARVVFSRNILLSNFEGVPALIFRMANARTNLINQAGVRVVALKNVVTSEGYNMRRQFDLKLVRDNSMAFVLPWTVIHKIEEDSPLYGMTEEDMKKCDLSLLVALTGNDDIFSSQVHAYHTYPMDMFKRAKRFVDMMDVEAGKSRRVNHQLIHEFVKS